MPRQAQRMDGRTDVQQPQLPDLPRFLLQIRVSSLPERWSVCRSVRVFLVNVREGLVCLAQHSTHPLEADVRRIRPTVGIATRQPSSSPPAAAAARRQFISHRLANLYQ